MRLYIHASSPTRPDREMKQDKSIAIPIIIILLVRTRNLQSLQRNAVPACVCVCVGASFPYFDNDT